MDFRNYNDNILNELNTLMEGINPTIPANFTPLDNKNNPSNQSNKKPDLSNVNQYSVENNNLNDITSEQLLQMLSPKNYKK